MNDILLRIHKAWYGYGEQHGRMPDSLYLGEQEYAQFGEAVKVFAVYDPGHRFGSDRYNGMRIYQVKEESHLQVLLTPQSTRGGR